MEMENNMIHILYVDDEEILLDLAKIFLERNGEFSVDISLSADEIIKSGNISSYDAIISDYMMPEMDGIEFLKAIRSQYPDIPFILFTGRGREEIVIEAINHGVDFYLQKGGDPKAQFAELGHKVEQAVKRRKIEKELINSEKRFNQIFQANHSIAGLSELSSGRFVDVNEAFLKRLFFTREEVIGKTFLELGILTEETQTELLKSLNEAGYLHNLEVNFFTKTNDLLYVLVSADIISSSGEDLLLVQATDITKRSLAEEKMKQTLENLEKTQRIARIGNWSLDLKTRQYSASDELYHMFGLPLGSVVGYDLIADLIHPQDRPRMREIFKTALKTGLPYNTEMRIVLPSTGEERYITTIGELEVDNEGKPIRVFGVNQDITELKMTSCALMEYEIQFQQIIDNFPVSITIVTINGNLLYANPQAIKLFELEGVRELTSIMIHDFWTNPKERKDWIEKLKDKNIVTDYEVEFSLSSGKRIWAILFGIFISFKGKKCILSAHHNITDRKLAEEELKKSEERYRFITDNSTDVIWTMNLDGWFTFVSPSVYHLRGYTPEEVIEKPVIDAISPGSVSLTMQIMNSTIEKVKTGLRPEPEFFEVEQPCKDGSTVWTEVVAKSLHDKHNNIIGFLGISRDITKRRVYEQALKESEQKFISIFNQTPDPILIIDAKGTIIEVNKGFEEIFGTFNTEITGKNLKNIGIFADDEQEISPLASVTKDGKVNRTEIEFINKNNSPFYAEVAISSINIQKQLCTLLQIHDINEIKHAHDAVKSANHKLNILSSITRHDILNRVMIASLYSEEMKEMVTDKKLIKYLDVINKTSSNIARLINLTKEYQDLGTSAPVWQRVETLIHEETITGLAQGIFLQSELENLEIYADLMLEKVLYNLVDNSVRHGNNLTSINFSYQIKGNDCILVYEDDGGGVLEKDKMRIFERGFGKNTGMGLFLIGEILSITGIKISETGTYGKGVRFEMLVLAGKWRIGIN
ncbi:MAG: PAS domain S-box protein [Methanomicrobiales archaeon]|nr:PAS domain S-box protein [Methanomicrobiales archaeon]